MRHWLLICMYFLREYIKKRREMGKREKDHAPCFMAWKRMGAVRHNINLKQSSLVVTQQPNNYIHFCRVCI